VDREHCDSPIPLAFFCFYCTTTQHFPQPARHGAWPFQLELTRGNMSSMYVGAGACLFHESLALIDEFASHVPQENETSCSVGTGLVRFSGILIIMKE
jgi:hypothetical protein